jgi:hypothetical protein
MRGSFVLGNVNRGLNSVWHLSKLGFPQGADLDLQAAQGPDCLIKDDVVRSQVLGTDRNIGVYLPPSYEKETQRRYPVLYVQDGQNIFSTAGTNSAFGWDSW